QRRPLPPHGGACLVHHLRREGYERTTDGATVLWCKSGLFGTLVPSFDPEIDRQANEFRHRGDFEFLQQVRAMELDGSLGDLKIGGDLLVQLAADQMEEDLAFARGQALVALTQSVPSCTCLSCFLVVRQ